MKTPSKGQKTNRPDKLKNRLGVLLVIGLILLIPLFFVIPIRANAPAQQATEVAATPIPVFTPGPGTPTTIPFIPMGEEPPSCAFPLAQTTSAESAPENYAFSDPKPVPLSPSWNNISLFQWLPDNQRVLMGRGDQDQILSLLNPQTGESQDFGSRPNPSDAKPPVWIPSLNAVLYPESDLLTPITFSDNSNGPAIIPPAFDYRRQLWLSRGDPVHLQPIVDELVTVPNNHRPELGEQLAVAASPDGSQIVYLDSVGKHLFVQKIVQGSFVSVPSPSFDATQWLYRTPINSDEANETYWNMTWRPNSTQVLLYSGVQTARIGGYTFLLDVETGKVCELNLWKDDPNDWRKIWAPIVHWSPNGRYLAVVRAKGSMIDFTDLIVLDTAAGKLYQIEPSQCNPTGSETQGNPYCVSDLAWAPDNRHVATIVELGSPSNSVPIRLFLLDFITGQSAQASSAELKPLSEIGTSTLLWSDDGSQLITECRTGRFTGGLCLMSVQKNPQP